jgi:hypothetical protein
MVDHHDLVRVEAVHLVSEEESSLLVGIVGHNKAFGEGTSGLDEFEELGGFGARSGAHVKNRVVGLDIQEVRREHRHDLLSAQKSSVVSQVDHLLTVFKPWLLLQDLSRQGELIKHISRLIVLFAVQFEVFKVNRDVPEVVSPDIAILHVIRVHDLILALFFSLFIFISFLSVNFLFCLFLDELRIFEYFNQSLDVQKVRVDPEGNREPLLELSSEFFKLPLPFGQKSELFLVVLVELRVSNLVLHKLIRSGSVLSPISSLALVLLILLVPLILVLPLVFLLLGGGRGVLL